MSSADALKFLLLGGFLGLFGQGVRALVGLNLLKDYANGPNPSQSDVFNAARLAISLVVGFIAGVATALTYVLKDGKVVSDIVPYLLPFAGAGYVGTDVIETFYVKYFDKGSPTSLKAAQSDAASPEQVQFAQSGAPAPRTAVPLNRSVLLDRAALVLTDEPGQKDQAIMDCTTAWLQADGKLARNQEVDPQGTLNGAYHFSGPPEVATFLKDISSSLIGKNYTYNYTKDTSLPILTKLYTSTVSAVAFEIGKNTKYTPGGLSA
jgi:hypothetical protein